MKRIIALLLVLATVLCLFVACKDDTNGDGPANSATVDSYDWPTNLDYSGYGDTPFRILTWGNTGGDHWNAYEFIYDESLTGDVLNDAVKTRDTVLEEKMGVKVEYVVQGGGDITEYARTSINAGSDDFDVASLSVNSAAVLAQEGMFIDLNDYSDILNLEEDYWDQGANEQLSFANHLYFTVSDLTLTDKQATWVVFFTKGLLEKYPDLTAGYENGIYSMVDEGEWTIEKMANMVKTVSSDTNGDNEMTDVDVYGHCGETFNLAALMVGCGAVAAKKDANDLPVYCFTDNVEQLSESYKYVHDIVTNRDYSMDSGRMGGYGYTDVWTEGFGGMMQDDRVLFNVTGMNRCRLYRDMEADFGIVPVPKANEQQENYRLLMTGSANCVAIPITAPDKEMICTVLEAMTCLANQTTYEAYIEKSLKVKYLRDDESEAMLEIIFDNRVYDLVDIYNIAKDAGSMGLFRGGPNPSSVASTIQALKKFTENSIKKTVSNFEQVYENTARQSE